MSNYNDTISLDEGDSMYYLLTILAGVMVTALVTMNGKLTEHYGAYPAVVIIHLIGLIFTLVLVAINKVPLKNQKKMPWYYYTGGVLTIATVLFNNLSFGRISVSAILALCLLGQSITSLVFDHYGFFNMPKSKFNKGKLLGIVIVLAGIAIMVSYYKIAAIVPVILSLITGLTVVLSRTILADLSENTSPLYSTFTCYAVAFLSSIAVLFAFGGGIAPLKGIVVTPNPLLYLGGIIGVLIVTLLNKIVSKISSLHMTLILFAGQVFSALVVDLVLSGVFSLPNFIGGIFVVIGLSINVWIDKREKIKPIL